MSFILFHGISSVKTFQSIFVYDAYTWLFTCYILPNYFATGTADNRMRKNGYCCPNLPVLMKNFIFLNIFFLSQYYRPKIYCSSIYSKHHQSLFDYTRPSWHDLVLSSVSPLLRQTLVLVELY